jgi:hypothetical protein
MALTLYVDPTDGEVKSAPSTGGGGGGANCATAPTLLCLAGRAAPANDPLISTTGFGSIYGSSAAPPFVGLDLNAHSGAGITLGPAALINLNANVTTWNGPNTLAAFGFVNPAVTINDVSGFSSAIVIGYIVTGTWTVADDSMGGQILELFAFQPTIQNTAGVAKSLAQGGQVYQSSPSFVANGAACTLDSMESYISNINFSTSGGGTLAVTAWDHYDAKSQVGAGVHLNKHLGYAYDGAHGSGTVDEDDAIQITKPGGVIVGSTRHTSMYCTDENRSLQHAGSGVFGAPAAPTSASVGLEVQSSTLFMLLSRLTSGGEAGLSAPVDGGILYNSSLLAFRGRRGGAWLSFIQESDEAALEIQTADIPDTAFANTPVPGTYRVQVYLVTDQADGAAGTVTAHIKFTDSVTAQDVDVGPINLASLGNFAQAEVVARAASGSITYGTTHTGIFNNASYALAVTCERVGTA